MTWQDQVVPEPNSGCHLYEGYHNKQGRPKYAQKYVSRLIMKPAAGEYVLHRCDNPGCLNPDHLYLGTYADNARDRGNRLRGTAHQYLDQDTIDLIQSSARPAKWFVDLGLVAHRNTVYYWRKEG